MDEINSEFIERYQLLLQRDPRSKVFAPLSEAYRKLGLLSQALEICKQGVKYHPTFVSGLVAYAKVLIETRNYSEASTILQGATKISPDNILAHRLLGQCQLQQRKAKEALKSFKMVLLLNPQDPEATKYVKKWEGLTADEYDEELFEVDVAALETRQEAKLQDPTQDKKGLVDQTLSLVDAYLVRNQVQSARTLLEMAAKNFSHPEIDKRLALLGHAETAEVSPLAPKKVEAKPTAVRLLLKRQILERLLQRAIVDVSIDAKA